MVFQYMCTCVFSTVRSLTGVMYVLCVECSDYRGQYQRKSGPSCECPEKKKQPTEQQVTICLPCVHCDNHNVHKTIMCEIYDATHH